MLQLALSQLKHQPRRYISVLLAIVVGVTFLAASLMVGSSSNASLRNSLGATYSRADLVIASDPDARDGWQVREQLAEAAGTADEPGALSEVDGVAEAFGPSSTYVAVQRPASLEGRGTASETSDFAVVTTLPRDASLVPEEVLDGALPEAGSTTQIALDQGTAQTYGLAVGDSVMLIAGDPRTDSSALKVTVSAVIAQTQDPMMAGGVQIRATDAMVQLIDTTTASTYLDAGDGNAEDSSEGGSGDFTETLPPRTAEYVLISLADGASPDAVRAGLQSVLDADGIQATVMRPDEQAQAQVAQMAGSNVFVIVLGAFAVIALLVTALVISITFSVLVAQRSRDLALQRALGASRAQVRGSVLVEAAIIGLLGSVLGLALGAAIVAGMIVIGRSISGFSFLTFGIDASAVVISLVVGVVLTVLASLAPATYATRVAPLEAMRPREDAALGNRAGVVRLVVGGLALVAGAALMVWAAYAGQILVAVAGGALSFLGVLMLAVLFVPAAVQVAGLAAKPFGVPGVMARLNAVRNPGRTAATAAALLIGTTLVAMMLTGGRTAQHEMDTTMATDYPVDVQVGLIDDSFEAMDLTAAEQARERIAAVPEVAATALLSPAGTTGRGTTVFSADPDQLRSVVAEVEVDHRGRLGEPGTILVPSIVEENTLTVTGPTGEITLQTVRSGSYSISPVITTADATAIGAGPEGTMPEVEMASTVDGLPNYAPQVWVQVIDGLTLDDSQEVTSSITQAAQTSQENVTGSMTLRLLYSQIIDGMLLVVTALLAVSVLIALIGVANTLSLSAIERTRENSLLRALGLTRGGLRGMLALEAVLISGVAALLGCTLGTLYGWMGSQAVLGATLGSADAVAMVWPVIPWWELAVIVGVSVLAGLLASVAPARRATRLSPVAGLATT